MLLLELKLIFLRQSHKATNSPIPKYVSLSLFLLDTNLWLIAITIVEIVFLLFKLIIQEFPSNYSKLIIFISNVT